jgi:hypothetical protein
VIGWERLPHETQYHSSRPYVHEMLNSIENRAATQYYMTPSSPRKHSQPGMIRVYSCEFAAKKILPLILL